MSTSLPSLSQFDIREWAPDRFFERGEGYFRQGRIRRLRRTDNTLRAECEGSNPEPYLVEVTLGESGITSYDCTCPVEGRCKHLVALLLTWIDASGEVPETEPLDNRLRQVPTDDLVDVIMEMVRRHPDLSRLAEMAANSQTAVEPERIRRQIQETFEDATGGYRTDNPYRAAVMLSRDLEGFLDRAKQLADNDQIRDATTVLCAFIEEGCDYYTRLPDREGRVAGLFDDATERLNWMLSETSDADLRRSILRTLTDLVIADIDFGGYGLGGYPRHVVLNHATSEERRALAEHVRESLLETIAEADDIDDESPEYGLGWIGTGNISTWNISTWKTEALGGLLLALEEDRLDDETYLALCKQTGRHRDLIKRLFELERREEAQDVARDLPDVDLRRVTDVFEEHDASDLFGTVVDERLDADTDGYLVQWRREYALGQDDQEKALTLTKRLLLNSYGNVQEYETLRSIAQDLGCWEAEQSEIHNKLRGSSTVDPLARFHLSDGDIGDAVDLASREAISRSMQIRVAGVAEDEYPEDAIDLYEREARRLIKGRGRSNYASAAEMMARAKALYESLGYDVLWEDTIEKLVEDQLHRLPAARDEFQKAGLL